MYALVLVASLLGQVDVAQQQREWLIAHLIVDRGFNAAQVQMLERQLAGMSASQVGALVEAYQQKQAGLLEKTEYSARVAATEQAYAQQKAYNDAVYNLEKMKAYRDYLKEQYQYQMHIKERELAISRQTPSVVIAGTFAFGYPHYPRHYGYYPRYYVPHHHHYAYNYHHSHHHH